MNIGLTGSIAMGKSTVAAIFAKYGVPVWDADTAVQEMYATHSGLHDFVRVHCPNAIDASVVDKVIWREYLKDNSLIFPKLEKLIHEYIRQGREVFLAGSEEFKLCDIPLLFETGQQDFFDKIIVVSAPAQVQRKRVLERQNMSEAQFESILARQMPDEEKRQRADYIIETDRNFGDIEKEVYDLLENWGYQHA